MMGFDAATTDSVLIYIDAAPPCGPTLIGHLAFGAVLQARPCCLCERDLRWLFWQIPLPVRCLPVCLCMC